jgi:phosphinothricin acetyltransferase
MLTLRDAGAADLPAIDRIYEHYVHTSTCTYEIEPGGLAAREQWFAEHDATHPVIVAEVAGEVVGWGSLSRHRARAGYRFTVEDSVYVDAPRRGCGVGSAILAHLVDRGRRAGHHVILAGVSADQAASIALHAKHGFFEVARFREVGFKFDRWLDVVYLQRVLERTR